MTAFVLAITNRASPLCSQNKTDKASNRKSARVLAWWVRALRAGEFELQFRRIICLVGRISCASGQTRQRNLFESNKNN